MAREGRLEVGRRQLLTGAGVALAAGAVADAAPRRSIPRVMPAEMDQPIELIVNGERHTLLVEPRVTLLDALRERIGLSGTKKGCDQGQCGACTVHLDGERVLACLSLAMSVAVRGQRVTTIEGLARGDVLHPVQQAFIKHDGFQCGYCTPGQIMSAVALLAEAKRGVASAATRDLASVGPASLTAAEVRERMSGNICRCAAYPNIVAAIQDAAGIAPEGQAAAGEVRA